MEALRIEVVNTFHCCVFCILLSRMDSSPRLCEDSEYRPCLHIEKPPMEMKLSQHCCDRKPLCLTRSIERAIVLPN